MNLMEFGKFIDELIGSGWYAPPYRYYGMKPEIFSMLSAKRWAILELKEFVFSHKKSRPIDSVELFRKQLDNYSCIAKNEEAKFMFSTAYDTVTNILDMLL